MERPAELRVDRPQADVAVFELAGEYDMGDAPELEAAVAEAIVERRGIVFDLSETQFLDSSTIHVLFKTQAALAKQGKRLALRIHTASVVMRALEICKVADTIPTTHDRDEAIRVATGSKAQD